MSRKEARRAQQNQEQFTRPTQAHTIRRIKVTRCRGRAMSMFDSRDGSQAAAQARTGVAIAATALSALVSPPAAAQQVITTQNRLSASYSTT